MKALQNWRIVRTVPKAVTILCINWFLFVVVSRVSFLTWFKILLIASVDFIGTKCIVDC